MEIELDILEDCLNLIDIFAETKNPSFKSFCNCWKNNKFQHIYAAQTTVIEVIQTTKTIVHLAKRIVCAKDELGKLALEQNDDADFIRRIGGIYLMYVIYFKQPTKQYVKVLVSYETWQEFLKFVESLTQNRIADEARYMFWHLYKADAFRFTALDYDDGLEKLVDYDHLFDIHTGNKSDNIVIKQKLMYICETQNELTNTVALEKKYNRTKKSISNNSAKSLPPTNIFQEIQNALKSIHNIIEDKNFQNTTIKKDGSNYEEKRKELKRKAAGRCVSDLIDEESDFEEAFQQDGTKKYFGKPSIRQIMTQKLPAYLNDDLKTSSTEDEDLINTEGFYESEQLKNDKIQTSFSSIEN
ncbi:proximal sequence element A Pbp45 [Cochliomyia hominivorax]